jgi:hypothetical protein
MQQGCSLFDRVETVSTWRSAFLTMLKSARALILETESFGVASTFTEHSLLKAKNSAKQAAIEHPVSMRAAKRHYDDSTANSTTGCTGCGRSNQQVQDCNFFKSPFFNKTTAKYKGSDAYNKLIAAYRTMYVPGSMRSMRRKTHLILSLLPHPPRSKLLHLLASSPTKKVRLSHDFADT